MKKYKRDYDPLPALVVLIAIAAIIATAVGMALLGHDDWPVCRQVGLVIMCQ